MGVRGTILYIYIERGMYIDYTHSTNMFFLEHHCVCPILPIWNVWKCSEWL